MGVTGCSEASPRVRMCYAGPPTSSPSAAARAQAEAGPDVKLDVKWIPHSPGEQEDAEQDEDRDEEEEEYTGGNTEGGRGAGKGAGAGVGIHGNDDTTRLELEDEVVLGGEGDSAEGVWVQERESDRDLEAPD